MHLSFKLIGLAGLLAFSFQAIAQEHGPKEDQVFGSVLGSIYDGPDDLDIRETDIGLGGGIGFGITDNWAIEASYFDLSPEVEVNGTKADGDVDYWTLNVLRSIGNGKRWQPYLTAGAGRAEFRYDGLQDKETSSLFNFGAGFFANLTEHLAFRTDLRGVYHNSTNDVAPMATVGLSYIIGGAKPAPVVVAAAPVDSDGDGVTDDRDACPNTPAGVSVDSRGCPLDSDGDGVPDHNDDCPNTPAGTKVDARGCPVMIEKPVTFNLTVEFAFDSAEITGVAFQEMLDLLKFLREYSGTNAVIEGHTDSRGADDYNQDLSNQRAAAVLEALTNSGIPRSRLSSVGYGESRPVASNDTDEGRAKNRRVTVVVSGVAKQ